MKLRLQLEVTTTEEYGSTITCVLYDEKGNPHNHVKENYQLTGRHLRKKVLSVVREAIEYNSIFNS